MAKYIIRYRTNQQFHDDQLAKAGKDVQPGQNIWFPVPGVSFTDEAKISDYNPIPKNVPTLIFVNETNQEGNVMLTAKQRGTGTYFNALGNRPKIEIEYSTDNQFFSTTASTDDPQTGDVVRIPVKLPANGKLYLRGKNETFAVGNVYMPRQGYSFEINLKYWSFSCDVRHSLDGYFMAVLNDNTAVTKDFELAGLFEGDSNLVSLSDIVLSSEHVPVGAYAYTFANSGLEVMPKLDAEYIEDYGAYEMFRNTNFATIGELRATTLGRAAYYGMFRESQVTGGTYPIPNASYVCSDENNKYNSGTWAAMFESCTALTNPPEIMQEKAYCRSMIGMFANCTNLVIPPTIHLNDLNTGIGDTNGANECLGYMFKGCTSLTGTPTFLADITGCGSMYGLQYMFSGCTNLVNAGTLGMTGINSSVCCQMFAGCTKLVTPPVMTALKTIYGGTTGATQEMFLGCTSLTGTPQLSLGFYHLAQTNHMAGMFKGCTSLTDASITLRNIGKATCASMFEGCTSLTGVTNINLPTTVGEGCYSNMFKGCISLPTSPSLPAATLQANCYKAMFSGCTSLEHITCIATDLSANDCTLNWVEGVASSGTFTRDANADWSVKTGNDGIPAGWTVQDA